MSLPTTTLSPSERSYIITSLSHLTQPTRLDARPLLESRPVQISYGIFPQASGSARVVLGGTEVVAGIKLEVVDVDPAATKGNEGWRTKVEVDVTPQAFPSFLSNALTPLSAHLTSLLSHFLPSVPALPILPPTKYFQPQLHLTVLSSSGNLPSVVILAARAAFSDLRIPRTKVISWSGARDEDADGTELGKGDLSGIKAAIGKGKGKGKGKYLVKGGEDWDLDLEGEGAEEGDHLSNRNDLPVLVTLNLVPNSSNIFLDATLAEESACPDRLHLFFTSSGKITGIRMEGGGIDTGRIRDLLEEGKRIAGSMISAVEATVPR